MLYIWYSRKFFLRFIELFGSTPLMSYTTLLLLAFSVILIAAAGYIINDYFDIRTDHLNRPENVIAGKYFSRKSLIFMNLFLNIIGIFLGFVSAYLSGHLSLGLVYVLAAAILLFYSSHLKKYPWIGNLVVALLIGFLPILFYMHALSFYHKNQSPISTHELLLWGKFFKFILLYGVFAFLLNLVREIIKDLEDMEGDRLTGALTIPIKYGVDAAKIFAFLINLILFILIAFVTYNTFRLNKVIDATYLMFLLLHLLLNFITGLLILRSKEKKDYHRVSTWLKLVMFFGLCMPLLVPMQ
ncbi:MAG: geranylgeranylglycerol-phosphate geranylgeranyltransferase [Bacteroidia bacterium]|nr:geranylgeranylglycerol-phosphate geranylgeranyltransferase [Bacteroidia bacterium]